MFLCQKCVRFMTDICAKCPGTLCTIFLKKLQSQLDLVLLSLLLISDTEHLISSFSNFASFDNFLIIPSRFVIIFLSAPFALQMLICKIPVTFPVLPMGEDLFGIGVGQRSSRYGGGTKIFGKTFHMWRSNF